MALVRSPGYPSENIKDLIETTRIIYDKVRRNAIGREAVAVELGYSGLTGASQKMLSNLTHFGLIEKAGAGDIRVSDLAIRILHPKSESERRDAILSAAFNPALFSLIRENYPDGHVTETALRSFLKRNEYSEAAISPAIRSYLDTYAFVQEDVGIDTQGQLQVEEMIQVAPQNEVTNKYENQSGYSNQGAGVNLVAGERVVFVDEASPSVYLKLVARGDLDDDMLEALEDFIKRMRKRIAKATVQSKPPRGSLFDDVN